MLKKTAMALAISMLAIGAHSAEISAGKDTKFEVNVDVGAYYLSNKEKDGTSTNEFLGKGLNQVEIKASHKLVNDITVFGEIEVDYDPITDNAALSTDDVRLGFSSPAWGRVSVGQFDSFYEDNVLEILGVGRGENGFVTEASAGNDGRKIQYSHKIGDLSFAADVSFTKKNAAFDDADNGFAFGASYKLGDLMLSAGFSDLNKYKSDFPTGKEANSAKSSMGLGASYKIGNVKLMGLLASEKAASDNEKTTYMGAGVAYAMGDLNLGLAVQQRKEGSDKFNEWSAGIGYTIFKGMETYIDLRGLNKPKNEGDLVEVGLRYSF